MPEKNGLTYLVGTKVCGLSSRNDVYFTNDYICYFSGEVVIGDDGWAEFRCSEKSVSVWANEAAKGRDTFQK